MPALPAKLRIALENNKTFEDAGQANDSIRQALDFYALHFHFKLPEEFELCKPSHYAVLMTSMLDYYEHLNEYVEWRCKLINEKKNEKQKVNLTFEDCFETIKYFFNFVFSR